VPPVLPTIFCILYPAPEECEKSTFFKCYISRCLLFGASESVDTSRPATHSTPLHFIFIVWLGEHENNPPSPPAPPTFGSAVVLFSGPFAGRTFASSCKFGD